MMLFARVFLRTFRTVIAMYATAPLKFAVALPMSRKLMSVVAAAAAH